jgi:hypothetical protein
MTVPIASTVPTMPTWRTWRTGATVPALVPMPRVTAPLNTSMCSWAKTSTRAAADTALVAASPCTRSAR